MANPDLSLAFAECAASAKFSDLSASAIERAKQSLLDVMGVALAASGMEPASGIAVNLALETGGPNEATILGRGRKVSAIMAAFANGAMAHSLDYDDQTPWGQHAASSLIPTVLALAERRGGVSGREMIAAIAVGQDMFNRLRRFVDWKKDWFFTTTMGVFSATAAAGRILGLPAPQIAHALGIASLQSAGTTEMVNATGSDLRAIYAGFPAKGAVMATLLAQRGLTGVPTLFEGKYGILSLLFGGRYDRGAILNGLGLEFIGDQTLYKRWPAVGTAHSHIHATMGLMRDNDLALSDIAELRIFVGDYHILMSEPLATRRAPTTLIEAKFSLPWLVAVAATRGDLKLSDFNDATRVDPVVLATAQKIVPVVDHDLDWKLDLPPGRVEIITTDGRSFVRTGTHVPGSAESPMTWADIRAKFADCAMAAKVPPKAENITRLMDLVQDLEKMEDVSVLARLAG